MPNLRYRFIRLTIGALITAGFVPAAMAERPGAAVVIPQQQQVEVVFVLDTTGSMSGLIQAAKEKIWAIANTLASAKPSPIVKMGLVGYRDRGDEYVTKKTALTADLDAVYKELMNFSAGGGGDEPESVNQALHEAIHSFPWTAGEDTYRVVFLVGDAPPHTGYANDIPYQQTVKDAARKGIVVNAVQCGTIAATTPVWSEIARLGEGQFFAVDQSGSAIAASTPFDARLGELAAELESTRLYYGKKEEQARMKERDAVAKSIASSAPASAKAQRALYNASDAGRVNFLGSKELVADAAAGKVDLSRLDEAELPEKLKAAKPEDRAELLNEHSERRKELQTEIRELAAKRQSYVEAEVRKGDAEKSLDSKIFQAIKTQGEKLGLRYAEGPAY